MFQLEKLGELPRRRRQRRAHGGRDPWPPRGPWLPSALRCGRFRRVAPP